MHESFNRSSCDIDLFAKPPTTLQGRSENERKYVPKEQMPTFFAMRYQGRQL